MTTAGGDGATRIQDDNWNPVTKEEAEKIEKCKFVEFSTEEVDSFDRKLVYFYAIRLPPADKAAHDTVVRYVFDKMKNIYVKEYSIVYFHYGHDTVNGPTTNWLLAIYDKMTSRLDMRMNFKALYIVHPTNNLQDIYEKFGNKVFFINYLHELRQKLTNIPLGIPGRVKEFDALLRKSNMPQVAPQNMINMVPPPTQQFGVDLSFIIRNNNGSVIPKVLSDCVSLIRTRGLKVEGIFRISAKHSVVKMKQQEYNMGKEVTWTGREDDVHVAANLITTFFRQMRYPLLTFDLYTQFVENEGKQENVDELCSLVNDHLNKDNFNLLKYLIHFLREVVKEKAYNLMTSDNLGVIFGPSLLYPQSEKDVCIQDALAINKVVKQFIDSYDEIFDYL